MGAKYLTMGVLFAAWTVGCGFRHPTIPLERQIIMTEQVNLKISPELSDLLKEVTPETELKLLITIEVLPPGLRNFREFQPDPKDYAEWQANASRMSELNQARKQGKTVDDAEVERLHEKQREVQERIDKQSGAFLREINEHNRSVTQPVRDAVLRRLKDIEGISELRPEIGSPSSSTYIGLTAKAYYLDDIAAIPGIARIEDNNTFTTGSPGLKYSRLNIRALDAVRTFANQGSGTVIGVLDTGVGPKAEEPPLPWLSVDAAQAFTNPQSDPDGTATHDIAIFDIPGQEWRGHCTPVAGIIRSTRIDEGGHDWTGVAPACTLLSGRIWKSNNNHTGYAGIWDNGFLLDAVEWLRHHPPASTTGKAVVNFSNFINEEAGTGPGRARDRTIDLFAWKQGVLWVGIVGNGYNTTVRAPGGAHNAITASAFFKDANPNPDTQDPQKFTWWPQSAKFSSMSPPLRKPDLCAPGASVLTTLVHPNAFAGGGQDSEGTSIAAPHVAGAAALVMSTANFPTSGSIPLNAKAILIHATDPSRDQVPQEQGDIPEDDRIPDNWHPKWGWGILNTQKAVAIANDSATHFRIGTVSQGGTTTWVINGGVQEDYGNITLCWEQQFKANDGEIPLSRLYLRIRWFGPNEATRSDLMPYNVKMFRHFRIPRGDGPTVSIEVFGNTVSDDIGDQMFVLVCSHRLVTV